MSEFSLQLSPSCNLKNHVSSAVGEVIRLLENFSLYGNDEEQLDFILYKREEIVYLCVSGQNIWSDFLTDEIIQLLLTAYLKKTIYGQVFSVSFRISRFKGLQGLQIIT